jgi:hypothetical protein
MTKNVQKTSLKDSITKLIMTVNMDAAFISLDSPERSELNLFDTLASLRTSHLGCRSDYFQSALCTTGISS